MLAIYLGPIALLVLLTLVLGWAHSHPADGREPAVFDCGRDGCQFRFRVNHRHRTTG